ncbi:MAG: CHAD domain-containing protein [Bacteroidales bacterium]|nr:CHAD domain-containing protein [Bacteroidales bacterium]
MNRQDKIFLLVYYNRQIDDICSSMKVIPGSYSLRDIHKLRVRIKRIKAVFRLLEYIYPSDFKAKEHYHIFKPVFKSAGQIREGQINLALLREAPCAGELRKSYSRHIARLRSGWEQDLDRLIHAFDYEKLDDCNEEVRNLLSQNTGSELVNFITGFIKSETERVRNILDSGEEVKYIHRVRIVLKNIKPLLGLVWRRKDNVFTKKHYECLNATETCIGGWHDRAILLQSLALFLEEGDLLSERLNEEYLVLQEEVLVFNDEAINKILKSVAGTLDLFST